MDFESDLLKLADRVRSDETFALDLYRALCNVRWVHRNGGEPYSCTWRAASGLVVELRSSDEPGERSSAAWIERTGDHWLDYYCAGGEGTVAEDVADALARLGWTPLAWNPSS